MTVNDLEMDKYSIFIIALLFSFPATRILGFSSYTVLLLFMIIIVLVHRKNLNRSIVAFNNPFLFLIPFSIFISCFYFLSNSVGENRLILTKNIELFNELLLVACVLGVSKKEELRLKDIKLFIEVYFYANLSFVLGKFLYPDLYYIFHYVDQDYVLNGVTSRVSLLGHEPSYTVPVTILLFMVYVRIVKRNFSTYVFFFVTVYAFVYGASKIAFIMVAIYALIRVSMILINVFKWNKSLVKYSIFLVFIVSSIFTYNYLDVKLGLSKFKSLNKVEQYEIISWKTRSELIGISLKLISWNPIGYGYGNSITVISNYVEDSIDDIESFEIVQANWSARSPKSQMLEYITGGGFIFLWLLYKFQIKVVFNQAKQGINRAEDVKYASIYILLLVTIVIGERIPYIFIGSMVFEALRIRNLLCKRRELSIVNTSKLMEIENKNLCKVEKNE